MNDTDKASSAPAAPPSRWIEVAVLAAGLILFAMFATLSHQRVLDDAYITYRFAEHLSQGHGLVWNVGGERTEGFTSPVHVLMCAAAFRAGWDPLVFTRVVSVIALLGCAVLCVVWIARIPPAPHWPRTLPWLLVLGNGCLVYAALFGLETLIITFLCTAAAYSWWRWCELSSPAYLALFVALALLSVMTRPDACAWVAGLLVSYLIIGLLPDSRSRVSKGFLQFSGAAVVLFVGVAGFAWWKYHYFGDSLPNPFYIKSAQGLISDRGVAYVARFVVWGAPVILGMLWGLYRIRAVWYRSLVLASGLFVLSFLHFEPLMGTAFRFLLPVWPVATVCGLLGLADMVDRLRSATRWRRTALFSVGAAGLLWTVAWVAGAFLHIQDTLANKNTVNYRTIGQALAAAAIEPTPTLAAHDQGALPYFSGWHTLDLVGLTTNQVARMEHADQVADFILDQEPAVIVLRRRIRDSGTSLYVPHARTGNLGRCLSQRPAFAGHYESVGSIPDEGGDRIVFFLRRSAPAVSRIAAALGTGLSRVEGAALPTPGE